VTDTLSHVGTVGMVASAGAAAVEMGSSLKKPGPTEALPRRRAILEEGQEEQQGEALAKRAKGWQRYQSFNNKLSAKLGPLGAAAMGVGMLPTLLPNKKAATPEEVPGTMKKRSLSDDQANGVIEGMTMEKRGAKVMDHVGTGVTVLMLANLGSTAGSHLMSHVAPTPGLQTDGGGFTKRDKLTDEQGAAGQTKKRPRPTSGDTPTAKKAKPEQQPQQGQQKMGIMGAAGHAVSLGFFVQTVTDLVPGMIHETLRVGDKATDAGRKILHPSRRRTKTVPPPSSAMVAVNAKRDVEEASLSLAEYPQVLARRSFGVVMSEEGDARLLRRIKFDSARYKPLLTRQ
jgi:hypothetical protein